MTRAQIEKRLAAVNIDRNSLLAQLDEKLRQSIIKCDLCGKGRRVGSLTLIQTYFYIRPYGCTGGDYWKRGERQYECPSCGGLNREGSSPDMHKYVGFNARITELAPYFGDKVDKYVDR